MMTRKELHDELWLLTKGMLQDSRIETTEATVVKRWREEHQLVDEFKFTVEKLDRFLYGGADGVFGASTRRAVIAARSALGFSPGDEADRDRDLERRLRNLLQHGLDNKLRLLRIGRAT